MTAEEQFVREIEAMGAARAAAVRTEEIPFSADFRAACVQNACGYYNRCWTCPPDAGEIDALIARVRSFRHAIVYQTISTLEDSYDIEGMHAASLTHNRLTQQIQTKWCDRTEKSMVLGAGACGVCETCTKPEGLPCRFPDRAITSLEACGVDVSSLARVCALPYINGQNTVTYFGMLLY